MVGPRRHLVQADQLKRSSELPSRQSNEEFPRSTPWRMWPSRPARGNCLGDRAFHP